MSQKILLLGNLEKVLKLENGFYFKVDKNLFLVKG